MTAIDLGAHNGFGDEREGATMGSKFTKMPRQYMAFSGKPNAHNRSLLSCFIKLNWLSMKGNDMIGTIVQFIKQDGSSQQTMSIDQPPAL